MITAISRIFVPIDFSECSRAALDYAVLIARAHGASVQITHIAEAASWVGPESTMVRIGEESITTLAEFLQSRAQEQMGLLVRELQELGSLSIFTGVEGGDPAESIIKASADFDLIVMGTHGRKGVARLFVGSVAEQVVRRANCPVLTIRKRDVKAPSVRAVGAA